MDCKWLASVAVAMLVPSCALADDDQAPPDQPLQAQAAPDHAPREWPHPPGGWLHPYVALDLGYHWPFAIDATSLDPAPDGQPYQWRYKLNPDWNAFLRVGYRVTPHLRVEFDGGLRESNINSIHSTQPMAANGENASFRPSRALSFAVSLGAAWPGSMYFSVWEASGMDAPVAVGAASAGLSRARPGASGRVSEAREASPDWPSIGYMDAGWS